MREIFTTEIGLSHMHEPEEEDFSILRKLEVERILESNKNLLTQRFIERKKDRMWDFAIRYHLSALSSYKTIYNELPDIHPLVDWYHEIKNLNGIFDTKHGIIDKHSQLETLISYRHVYEEESEELSDWFFTQIEESKIPHLTSVNPHESFTNLNDIETIKSLDPKKYENQYRKQTNNIIKGFYQANLTRSPMMWLHYLASARFLEPNFNPNDLLDSKFWKPVFEHIRKEQLDTSLNHVMRDLRDMAIVSADYIEITDYGCKIHNERVEVCENQVTLPTQKVFT